MAEFTSTRKARLEGLRRQIAKASTFSAGTGKPVPLGLDDVDACLNGGLACALHEIAAADHRSTPAMRPVESMRLCATETRFAFRT